MNIAPSAYEGDGDWNATGRTYKDELDYVDDSIWFLYCLCITHWMWVYGSCGRTPVKSPNDAAKAEKKRLRKKAKEEKDSS